MPLPWRPKRGQGSRPRLTPGLAGLDPPLTAAHPCPTPGLSGKPAGCAGVRDGERWAQVSDPCDDAAPGGSALCLGTRAILSGGRLGRQASHCRSPPARHPRPARGPAQRLADTPLRPGGAATIGRVDARVRAGTGRTLPLDDRTDRPDGRVPGQRPMTSRTAGGDAQGQAGPPSRSRTARAPERDRRAERANRRVADKARPRVAAHGAAATMLMVRPSAMSECARLGRRRMACCPRLGPQLRGRGARATVRAGCGAAIAGSAAASTWPPRVSRPVLSRSSRRASG